MRGRRADAAGAGRRDLHLPDASADPPGRPGLLPDLRHGARAGRRRRRDRPERRTADMTRRFWIGAVLALPVVVLEMGGTFPGLHLIARVAASRRRWIAVCVRDAGRAVGRLAVLRARLGVASQPLAQHVQLIALGIGVAYLYSLAATFAPGCSRRLSATAWRRRGLFRSGRRHHRAGAARPGAGTARARADRRRHPRAARPRAQDRRGAIAMTAATKRSRSSRSQSATACGCARATACRSTAWWSRAAARSMNRWSPANPCRSSKEAGRQGDRRHASTAPAASSCAPKRSARDTMLARIVQMVAEAQRSRAPIQRLADQRRRPGSCRRSSLVALVGLRRLDDLGTASRAFAYALVAAVSRADHRLPLRARPGDADVDHGRRRPRRARRRPDQERRGAGALRERSTRWSSTRPARLTEGKPRVVAIVPAEGFDEAAVLSARAPASSARASIRSPPPSLPRPAERGLDARRRSAISTAITGKGVTGTIDGRKVALGNAKLLTRSRRRVGCRLERRATIARATARPPCSSPSTASSPAFIAVADPIKATTRRRSRALRGDGIRIVMLTGDNRATAQAVARQARHRRHRGRSAARAEERGRRAAAKRRPRRRHGRRRRQRRAGARRGRCRHRHGHGNRRRHRRAPA